MATLAEIRAAILEAMHPERGQPRTQFTGLNHAVSAILARREGREVERGQERPLQGQDERLFREILWELIATGVVVPGMNSSNDEWPWLSLTTEGEEYVRTGEPSPADPDQFLARIRENYRDLPDTVFIYVWEAVSAFNRRLYLATSVMVGVAAEGLLDELAKGVRDGHMDPDAGGAWYSRKIENQHALAKYRAIAGKLDSVRGDMPRGLRENYEAHFSGIYGVIREQRNDAGHPTGNERTREDVLPSLHLFAAQARLVRDLSERLRQARPL